MITRRAVDVLQPDVAACGGISELKKIADMASAFGVRVNPDVLGTGVALAASLHLLAVLPDNPPGLFPRPPLLELTVLRIPRATRCWPSRSPSTAAAVRVPEGPGLGIAVRPGGAAAAVRRGTTAHAAPARQACSGQTRPGDDLTRLWH